MYVLRLIPPAWSYILSSGAGFSAPYAVAQVGNLLRQAMEGSRRRYITVALPKGIVISQGIYPTTTTTLPFVDDTVLPFLLSLSTFPSNNPS